jgi:hypothetical protein
VGLGKGSQCDHLISAPCTASDPNGRPATTRRFTLIGAKALALLPIRAFAQANELVLYCSVGEDWCRAQSEAFTRETGIDVLMTRK